MNRPGKPENEPDSLGELWTLPELCHLVELALQTGYDQPQNRQIRPVPDVRTIRFYATLGLLDRPAAMRGRTACYARRHLMQLVAVKRLQAQGLPLSQVQQRLYGLDDEALAGLAQLPAGIAEQRAERGPAPPPAEARAEGAFWEAEPAPPAPSRREPAEGRDEEIVGVDLDEQVTILLRGAPPLSAAERHALREAAAPLLRWLRQHGLLGREQDELQCPPGQKKENP